MTTTGSIDEARQAIEAHARQEHSGSAMPWQAHEAYRLACSLVWEMVDRILTECEEAVKAGEVTSDDDLLTRRDEECDSASIYTLTAETYLLGSDNADACLEHTGSAPESSSVAMWWALMEDVGGDDRWTALVERVKALA